MNNAKSRLTLFVVGLLLLFSTLLYAEDGNAPEVSEKLQEPQHPLEQKIHRLLEEVRVRPDNAILRNNLAVAYTDWAVELFNEGAIDLSIQKLEKAIVQYEKAVKIKPSDTDILRNFGSACYNLGVIQRKKRQFEFAIASFEKSAHLFEGAGAAKRAFNAQLAIARIYYHAMNDLELARIEFTKLIRSKKQAIDANTLSEVYVDLASIYIATNDMSKAREALEESIKVSQASARSHLMLGQVYFWLGQNEKASNEMQLAEQFASSSYDLNLIGNAYRSLNKCAQASRLYKKALENASITKHQIEAYIGWGHCSEGNVKISYFEKAVALDPNKTDPDLHFARGKLANARFSKGNNIEDLSDAIQSFNKAIEYRPKVSAYHNDLAIAYMNLYMKKCDEEALSMAMKEFQLSKELHRGLLDSILLGNLAYEYLIYVVARQRGCEEARSGIYQRTLKEIAAGQSVSEETLHYLEESISYYERAITLSPERKDLYENLRFIYHGLNRNEGVSRVEARAVKFGIPLSPIEMKKLQ